MNVFSMHNCFIGFTLLILTVSNIYGQKTESEFKEMLEDMYQQTVPLITPDKIQEKGLSTYLFLDSRELPEFVISHIEGAKCVGYDHFQSDLLADIPKDKPIVVYCSVGYRSERIGEKLQKLGFSEVYNLYGGIFHWSNQGHSIVNESGKTTNKVHGYNKEWSQWVLKGESVY